MAISRQSSSRAAVVSGIVLLLAAPQSSSAIDIVVKQAQPGQEQTNWRCESRAVKADFEYLCSNNHVCTLNDEKAWIRGQLTYYGLYDIEGATEDDVLLVESYASLNTHVGYKHRMDLLPLQTVPVCGMVQQDENGNNIYSSVSNWYKNNFNNNQNAVCPQDGQYPFEASFQFQAPKSRFLSWLATGYHGEAVVDIYMQRTMDLVGRCHLPIKTKPTLPLVSGMIAMTSLFVLSLVGLTYFILWGRKGGRGGGYRCLGTKENEESLLPDEDDYVTAMDEFGVKMETARKQHKRTPQDLVAW